MGRVEPQWLKHADTHVDTLAADLVRVVKEASGKQRMDLDDELSLLRLQTKVPLLVVRGLEKALLDRVDFSSARTPELADARMKALERATLWRQTGATDGAEMRDLTGTGQCQGSSLGLLLYADRPAFDRVAGVPELSGADLVGRYNLGLLQGLVALSKGLTIICRDTRPENRRRLMRYMRFFGLLPRLSASATVGASDPVSVPLEMTLDGPLAQLQGARKYGVQVASFLPAVFQLDDWELRADVNLQSKSGILQLDSHQAEELGLRCHFQHLLAFRPSEVCVFPDAFNKLGSGWEARNADQLLRFSDGDLAFPDVELRCRETGRVVFLEIFHAWHAAPFQRRRCQRLVSFSEVSGVRSEEDAKELLLAVDQKLISQKSRKADPAAHSSFPLLVFRSVLSPKAVARALSARECLGSGA